MADQMEYRSTNAVGYTHFQGDVISGVGDARGWRMGTASSGIAPFLEVVCDVANAGGAIRAKGTGNLIVGSTVVGAGVDLIGSTITFTADQISLGSAATTLVFTGSLTSTQVTINSTEIQLGTSGALVTVGETTLAQLRVGGSTAPFNGFLRVSVANCTTFNFTSTDAGVSGETTVTVTGVNSSHFVTANAVTFPTAVNLVHAYPVASTAASVHLVWVKGSTVAVGNSTANVRFMVTRF